MSTKLSEREIDIRVAGMLFGWEDMCILPDGVLLGADNRRAIGDRYQEVPNYTTNPSDDYLVLLHVREHWDIEQQELFAFALREIWLHRALKQNLLRDRLNYDQWLATMQEPGDYSKAALHALGVEV